MGYGEEGEMGYRIWIPQFKKIIRSRDVIFNEAKLLQSNDSSNVDPKKVKFQHVQPPINGEKDAQDAPQRAENHNQPIVIGPDDVGQPLDAPENDVQPREHAENRAVNDGLHPINDDLVIPPDVERVTDDVDHWVRRSTRVRRLIQRFDPSLQYINR